MINASSEPLEKSLTLEVQLKICLRRRNQIILESFEAQPDGAGPAQVKRNFLLPANSNQLSV